MDLVILILLSIVFYYAIEKASKRNDELFFKGLFTCFYIAVGYMVLYFLCARIIYKFIESDAKDVSKMVFFFFLGALSLQRITIPYICKKGLASYRQIQIGLHISSILTALFFFVIEDVAGKRMDASIRNYCIFSTTFYLISSVIASVYEEIDLSKSG